MTISPKAIEALINIEQGLQQAKDLVDNARMAAWAVENKDRIDKSIEDAQAKYNTRKQTPVDKRKATGYSKTVKDDGSIVITIHN